MRENAMTEKQLKSMIKYEPIFRRGSAAYLRNKASYAKYQTGELGRKRTIISVDHDEAIVLEWAIDLYLEKTEELLLEADK